MNTTDKIRAHFRKNPNADVNLAAVKFNTAKARIYKLRKEVQGEGQSPVAAPEEGMSQGVLVYDGPKTDTGVNETLDNRAQDYGTFRDGAALMQGIKRLLADHALKHNKTFTDDQWEALEMIVHKMARIVNGNPDKVDSWLDIAGYATLVSDRLQGNAR